MFPEYWWIWKKYRRKKENENINKVDNILYTEEEIENSNKERNIISISKSNSALSIEEEKENEEKNWDNKIKIDKINETNQETDIINESEKKENKILN